MPKKQRPDSDRRLRQNSRLARLLRVLELIQGHGRWNATSIARELECSERTVYRDLGALELAGVPWYFDEVTGGYQVRPGFRFQSVSLSTDELLDQATASVIATATGVMVGDGAKSATLKLAATSGEATATLINDVQQLTAVLDLKLADHTQHRETIRSVQWALAEGKQLVGKYHSPYQPEPTKLNLNPYRLCLAGQAWYLIARPANEPSPKTYRVARFQSLRATDKPAGRPEDFDLRAYFGNAWNVFRGPTSYDIEIEFTADAATLVTETQWHPTQQVLRRLKDGRIVLSFTVDGLDEIVWWILGWSGRVKVLKPDELRVKVVEQLHRALRLNAAPE